MTQWWNQRTAAASCSHVFRINWNLFLHELETLMRKLYISSKLWPQSGALFLLTVLRHDGSEPAPSLPLPPPPVCRWGRCIKESFSRWKQTPAAAHTEIFVTNCRISRERWRRCSHSGSLSASRPQVWKHSQLTFDTFECLVWSQLQVEWKQNIWRTKN